MTEQEKQIDEMADEIYETLMLEAECPLSGMDCAIIADLLVGKGYRKAIEVVREIFNDLVEMWHKGRGFINYSDLVRLERLHEQKYTEGEGNDTK